MNRISYKTLLVLLLVIVFASMGTAVFAQDNIELNVVWWGTQNRADRTIAVIEMYEAAHPNVDIVYEFAAFNDYWVRLNTQAASGELACVMQHDYAYLAEWANRGLLAPLDPFFESGAIDISNIEDSYLAGGRVNDQVYGLSLGTNSQSFILDVDAFEAAGVELPALDWTWADFEEISMAIHDASGIYGMAYGLEDVQIWKGLYLSLGYTPFNEDGTGFGYEDDQPLIDLFNMILRLQEAGAYPTPDVSTELSAPGLEGSPIVTGQEAMRYQWSNQVVALLTAAGEGRNFALWPLPRAVDGASANYLKPSMFFSITEGCETPDEAADFINFFTNSTEANEVLFAERGVPVSSVIRDFLTPMLDATNVQVFEFLETVQMDSSPIFPADPPGFTDFLNNVWNPQFVEPVRFGQVSPEDAVEILRSEADAIFSQNAD
jgi:multiple sugar transport system substrate-binding protein